MTDDLFLGLRIRQSWRINDRKAPNGNAGPVARSPAFVGRVTPNPLVPASPGRFFSVHPVIVLGTEGENQAGSLAVNTAVTVPVFVIGPKAPLAGDDLICRFVGHRWMAEGRTAAGGGTVSIPDCLCQAIPNVLHQTSPDPSRNGGMFQNCVLAYADTPPQLAALSLGNQCFLSTTSFTDQDGETFRYYYRCNFGEVTLSRAYATSIFGSPFLDSVRYAWPLGVPGNTCSPFLLNNGQIYQGGDPGCAVTITE